MTEGPYVLLHVGVSVMVAVSGNCRYESTMDQLYNLASLLAPGGCIIIDDWLIPECKKAVEEFLAAHDISPTIHDIDGSGAYFCTEKRIDVKQSHYIAFNAGRKTEA